MAKIEGGKNISKEEAKFRAKNMIIPPSSSMSNDRSRSSSSEKQSLRNEGNLAQTEVTVEQTSGRQQQSSSGFNSLKKGANNQFNKFNQQTHSFFNDKVEGLEYNKKFRDPKGIHDNLKVTFQDVIAEPYGTTSFNQVWGTSYKTYAMSRTGCYKVLTCLLGGPIALFWGLYFACLAFINIWVMVPFMKALYIMMKFVHKIWDMIISTIFDPLFSSLGKVFGDIRITVKYQGAPKKEFDV